MMRLLRALRIGSRINNSTSGSVLFVDSNNRVAEDNPNLFWDDANNRLGIGTDTPSKDLHVIGETQSTVAVFTPKVIATIGEGGTLQLLPTDNGISNFGSIIFGGNSGTQMSYDATLNSLKIGSAIANENLVVVGTARITDTVLIKGVLTTTKGRIVNTDRYTSNQLLDDTNHIVKGNTDSGAFNITLPTGVDGTAYKISNTGSTGNDLTLIPDGTDLLVGDNANFDLVDGETLDLVYETSEGWIA